jgi:hypothetical protein
MAVNTHDLSARAHAVVNSFVTNKTHDECLCDNGAFSRCVHWHCTIV